VIRPILGIFITSIIVAAASAYSTAATTGTVVDLGRNKAIIYTPSDKPFGSVILVAGGSTRLAIVGDGSNLEKNWNFLVRTRMGYAAAGFVTALAENSDNLAPLIARLRAIARPVFVIGTSNGTIVTVANATRLGPDGPDGIVLTSTVTKSGNFGRNVLDYPLKNLRIPVLFVHNTNDGCPVSPPSGVQAAGKMIDPSLVTVFMMASTQAYDPPCEPISPHGYFGIETPTTEKIVEWMKAHGTRPQG
jgi:hypothetical protein